MVKFKYSTKKKKNKHLGFVHFITFIIGYVDCKWLMYWVGKISDTN